MQIVLGHSLLLLIASAAVAAAVSYWMYHRTTPSLSPARKWILGGLRFASLTLILFLLARPILVRLFETRVPPVLAVLLDSSQSIGISSTPGDSASAARVREIVEAAGLRNVPGEVHIYGFDSEVRPIPEDSLETIRFEGQRTDIAFALERLEDAYVDSNLGGVLLVSDGRYNSGRNPVHTAGRSRVPIYTITVGDTTEQRDVRLTALHTNELTYSGVEVPVRIGLGATGFEGRRVTVSLSANDTVVDSAPVDLPPDRVEHTIELSFVPDGPGLVPVEARVTPLEGEITTRNNVASTAIKVLDSQRKVLLVAGAPDPDVSALYQTISAGDETEVTRIVQRDETTFYEESFPDDVSDFDVVVLVGYPGPDASAAHLRQIADAARSGTPILFTLTRNTDLRLFDQYLAGILGVGFPSARQAFFEAGIVLTPAGSRHPVFEGLGDGDALTRLPPLAHNQSNWSASADASVLGTIRVRGIDVGDPAIVTRRAGALRTAAILGAGHWRLTNLPEDLAEYDEYWPSVISNLLRWLSAVRDDRPVRVRTTRDQFAGDEEVDLVGQVYDESLNPVDDAQIEVRITSPEGSEFRHVMKPIGNGRYTLRLRSTGEGTYRFSATATKDGTELGDDSGSFAVGNLTLEFLNTTADPDLMRQIAYRSGGRSLQAQSLPALSDSLREHPSFVVQSSMSRHETELWRQFPAAIVIIVLLSIEWVLRKRSGLS